MIRVNATNDQRLLIFSQRFQALSNPPLVSILQLTRHELSQILFHLSELDCLNELFDELLVYSGMSNSDSDVVSVKIDTECASSKEFQFQTTNSLACLNEIGGIGK